MLTRKMKLKMRNCFQSVDLQANFNKSNQFAAEQAV